MISYYVLNHTYTAQNIIRTICCILILHIFANYILQFDALSCKTKMTREQQMENVRFYKRLRKKLISINVTKGIDHTKTLKQSHKVQINRKQ